MRLFFVMFLAITLPPVVCLGFIYQLLVVAFSIGCDKGKEITG